MRKSRYSEEPITRVLRQVESGQKVKDIIREHGISEQTCDVTNQAGRS